MLAKLVKYDLKSTLRTALVFWAAALILAVYNHFSVRYMFEDKTFVGTLNGAVMGLFFTVMASLGVVVLILIIQRFWKGLLGDEGYLMFTVPATVHQLVLSKALSATVISALSALAGAASIIMIMPSEFWNEALRFIRAFEEEHGFGLADLIVIAVCALICMCCACLMVCFKLYTVMSIGHMARRHKKMLALFSWFVISGIENFIGGRIYLAGPGLMTRAEMLFDSLASSSGYTAAFCAMLFSAAAVNLVIGLIYYLLTCRILESRLDLE